jgi:invasion protein IalB
MLMKKRVLLLSSLAIGCIALSTGHLAAQQQIAPAPRPAARQTQSVPAARQPASSQTAPSAPTVTTTQSSVAPPSSTGSPQRTTATYDDWIIECETQVGTPPRKVCEMAQTTQVNIQGKTQPFSRVAIGQLAKDKPVILVIQLPVNVSFATKVHVRASDNDPGVDVPFARCVPNGCFAELDLKDDILKKFRVATAAGKLVFADAGSRNLSLPISFNGFGRAFDALMRE